VAGGGGGGCAGCTPGDNPLTTWIESPFGTGNYSDFNLGDANRFWKSYWTVNFPASPCPSPSNITFQYNKDGAGWVNVGTAASPKACSASATVISENINQYYYQFIWWTQAGVYQMRAVHACTQVSNVRTVTVIDPNAGNPRLITAPAGIL